jgi:hypothetical protein
LARTLVTVRIAYDDLAAAQRDYAGLESLVNQLPFISLNHLLLSTAVALNLYAGDVPKACSQLETRWAECRRNSLHRFPLLRCMTLGMRADCLFADQSLPAQQRSSQLQEIAKQLDAEAIDWAPAVAQSVRARAHELRGDSYAEQIELRKAIKSYSARGMRLPAAIAEFRLAQLAAGPRAASLGARARQTLLQFGIASPERWRMIAHSVY